MISISSSRRIVLNRLLVRGGRNGISINLGSDVNIHNTTVRDNNAVGVLVTQSTLNLDSSTISNNTLSATSIIPLTPTPAPGVNSISSVICDNSSVIGGDLQGINKISCKGRETLAFQCAFE